MARLSHAILIGLLGLLLATALSSPALAETQSIELSDPIVTELFFGSTHVAVYSIPGLSGAAVSDLIEGRVRLEVARGEEASTRECSTAISCILEAAGWEERIQNCVASVRVIGTGVAYFQLTANLIEHEDSCDGADSLSVVLWWPVDGDSGSFLDSIESIQLKYDEGS
jgi:hypothetical protein